MYKQNHVSVGAWLVYYIVMLIPIVDIIFFLVLLFSSGVNKTFKNFLKSQLVIIVIGILLSVFLMDRIMQFLAPYMT